jgi:hypothetical protein
MILHTAPESDMTLDVARGVLAAAVAVCGVSGISGAALLNGRQTPACVEVRIILLSSFLAAFLAAVSHLDPRV